MDLSALMFDMAASLVFPNVQAAPAQDGPTFEAVLGSVETEADAESQTEAAGEAPEEKQKEETAPAPTPATAPGLPFLLAVPATMPPVIPEQVAAQPAAGGKAGETAVQAVTDTPETVAPSQAMAALPEVMPETPHTPETPAVENTPPDEAKAPAKAAESEKDEAPEKTEAPEKPSLHAIPEVPAPPPPRAPEPVTAAVAAAVPAAAPTPASAAPVNATPKAEVRTEEVRRAGPAKQQQQHDHAALRIPVTAGHNESPPVKGEVAISGNIEPKAEAKPDPRKSDEPAPQLRVPEARIEQAAATHTAAAAAEPVNAPAAPRVSVPAPELRPEIPVRPASVTGHLEAAEDPKVIQKTSPFKSVETLRVTVGGSGEPRAEVRITQRNGTIEMAVRTPHPELARELRTALPELGSALDSQGFRSEIREVSTNRPETQQDEGRRSNQQQFYDEQQQRRHRRPAEKEEDDY